MPLFKHNTNELSVLRRKFRALIDLANESERKGDVNVYAHRIAEAELVARKIVKNCIKS